MRIINNIRTKQTTSIKISIFQLITNIKLQNPRISESKRTQEVINSFTLKQTGR